MKEQVFGTFWRNDHESLNAEISNAVDAGMGNWVRNLTSDSLVANPIWALWRKRP